MSHLTLPARTIKSLLHIQNSSGNHVFVEKTCHLNQRALTEMILLSCLRKLCHALLIDLIWIRIYLNLLESTAKISKSSKIGRFPVRLDK